MYDANTVLDLIDAHKFPVILLGTVALLCNYVFFYEAARCAKRDRCVPFLLLASTLWFAHDANFLLDYGKWFNTYDHWFTKLFWVGLMVTFTFEIIQLVQIFRYGRPELAPKLSPRDYKWFVVGAIGLGLVFWIITKATLDDPLYLMTFMLTAVWALGSNAALAARRGNRRGQSILQWGAFTGMIASYGAVSIVFFEGEFRNAPWVLLSVTGVVGGLGMMWWLSRVPAYVPEDHRAVSNSPSLAQ